MIWEPVAGMFVLHAPRGLLTTGRAPPGELPMQVSFRAHELRPAQRWDRLRNPLSAVMPRAYPNRGNAAPRTRRSPA